MLIVKTGSAVPEARADGTDFEHWFADGLGCDAFDYRTVRVDSGARLPALDEVDAVLVTGSPAMVSEREAWSERTARWLTEAYAVGLPMLGVCYGHQLLAHALGGRVGPNPDGRHMGRVSAEIIDPADPLLGELAPCADVHVSHLEAVLAPPPRARRIASAPHDPHHALRFGPVCWGVQFHPEFDAAVMRAYIDARVDVLRDAGKDPDALRSALGPGTRGCDVLARFASLARTAVAA
jgi:GMP synthase (glutamine-hydrolysing)